MLLDMEIVEHWDLPLMINTLNLMANKYGKVHLSIISLVITNNKELEHIEEKAFNILSNEI